MTLIAAWVRHQGKTKELYVAGDSRLSGGQNWDIGTKILDLGRGDVVIAFAGLTEEAYPLMLQLQSAVKMHPKIKSRAYDLVDLKGYVVRIFNAMWKSIDNLPVGQEKPDPATVRFMLCGYSWRFQEFKIWTLYFESEADEFRLRQTSRHRKKGGGNKYFAFIGDEVAKATNSVYTKLKERNRVKVPGMEMEPFETLVEFIRNKDIHSIGGAPQVWKVYTHLNTMPLNVYWPSSEHGLLSFGGRTLLPYERNSYLALDPDSLEVNEPIWPDPHLPC
ncbi:MAG: hypothetical protein OQK94_03905 [Gammaproteobacteria bacterium]|nr:hypothetical protein [Gammaproteobacteria bacterium]MCW8839450.1 hypothetical protein [Gammaproteobacteria bacterium]MCW8959797.1 hypothetical protein [Gammaproteobacteria bacterium]MCW8972041.1 hypothetical protein [Gammaproteobacteria bacterium]MCW8993193.1 hypothetical protein [Gammaproteobacteria bacterium]